MSRDISPPAAKRRKLEQEPVARQSILPPEPLPTLSPNSIRTFSWNVNGIAPFLQKQITNYFQSEKAKVPPASLRAFLHRHNWPSILLLQEVKIATKDIKTQDAVRAAINSKLRVEIDSKNTGPTYEAHFVLPNDPYNARGLRGNGKVYGVASIFRTDLRDTYKMDVRTVSWDKEGRISVVEVTTTDCRLAIFNIYAVNGTENPYHDPATGMVKGTRHDRKLNFHRLLMEECKRLEEEGWCVLLGGDMNVAPAPMDGHPKLRTFPHQHVINRAHFHKTILSDADGEDNCFNGVDVWRETHGEERRFTWYSRTKPWGTSCDRVDYFVADRKSWDQKLIEACGIMNSEEERGPSDHCPIWVDVKVNSRAGHNSTNM